MVNSRIFLTVLKGEMWKIDGLFPDVEAWKLHHESGKCIKNVALC